MGSIQLIELIILLILVGFFAGTNIAFKHINRFSMEIKRKKGLLSGKILSQYKKNSVRYIASGTIGYLTCLVLISILLDYILTPYWDSIPFGSFNSVYLKIIVLAVITAILLLPFTLIARSHFRAQANKLLPTFSFLTVFFSKIFYPITSFMTGLSNWMLQYLFNVNITQEGIPFDIAKEGTAIYNADKTQSSYEELNTLFFENALNLPQVKIRNCLTPRKEIKGLRSDFTEEELKQAFIETKHAKIIIYNDNIDNIIGYVHQLDLFKKGINDIKSLIRPITAVPETMNIITLLTKMTKEKKSIVWVVDEYGGTGGIITLEDLLEEIFGNIGEEYENKQYVEQQIAEKEFLLSGRIELDHLTEKYQFLFDETDSETLSGYIIAKHESIPQEKEILIIGNFEFDIINVTDTRIEMVKMRILG